MGCNQTEFNAILSAIFSRPEKADRRAPADAQRKCFHDMTSSGIRVVTVGTPRACRPGEVVQS